MSATPWLAFVTHPEAVTYLWRNATLVWLQHPLGDATLGLPYSASLNGSLWTLVHEVACYGTVLAAGLVGFNRSGQGLRASLVLFGVGWLAVAAASVALHPRLAQLHELALPFALGMAGWAWRKRLAARWDVAVALVLAASASRVAFGPGALVTDVAWTGALAYGTAVLAVRPQGRVRAWNRVGDYPYGVYLWAFPIQQATMRLAGTEGPWANLAVAAPVTILCAAVSWHVVERPTLLRRHALAAALRGLIPVARATR